MRTPARPPVHLPLLVALTTLACAPAAEAPPPPAGPPRLALLGLNGQRLGQGDTYRVPFNAPDRPLPLWTPVREALALENRGASPLTVEAAWLIPRGDTHPDEFTLLAPTRAADTPLGLGDRTLRPGERLDFDLRAWLVASGRRRADLHVRWAEGADLTVHLEAHGAGDARLWPVPEPVAGWRLAPRSGAPLSPSALAFTRVGAFALSAAPATGDAPAAAVVSRVTPDGRLAWATALDANPEVAVTSAPNALCASDDGAAAWVGRLRGADGRELAMMTALGADGTRLWSRTWTPDGAEVAALSHCAIADGVLWVAGTAGPADRATADRVVAASLRLGDGLLLGAWDSAPDPTRTHGVAAVVASSAAGALVLGGSGKDGFAWGVGEAAPAAWTLPGPAAAGTALAGGATLVAWHDGAHTVVGRLEGEGTLRWTRPLAAGGKALVAADGARAALVVATPSAWRVTALDAHNGALHFASTLFSFGSLMDRPVAVHIDAVTLWLADATAGRGRALWYEAAAPHGADRGWDLPARPNWAGAAAAGAWRDVRYAVVARDVTADFEVRDDGGALGPRAPGGLALTGLALGTAP